MDALRSDAANDDSYHRFNHAATVSGASLTGLPASMRSRTFLRSLRHSAAVFAYTGNLLAFFSHWVNKRHPAVPAPALPLTNTSFAVAVATLSHSGDPSRSLPDIPQGPALAYLECAHDRCDGPLGG